MADKIKKNPEEIRTEILNQLKNGPKTIAEIGEAINSNWLTIEKFLKELKDEGKITEVVSSPKMRVYRRTDDIAFYGLPFSEEIRNKSCSLLFAIANKWKVEKGIIPARTTLQKVAVELVETPGSNLSDIPVLRFHYGQTLAVMYNPLSECAPLKLDNNQQKSLSKLISEYDRKLSAYAKSKQYKKNGMELYKEKEDNISKSFLYFNDENVQKAEQGILRLSMIYPVELKKSFQLFDRLVYCSTNLLNLKNKEDRQQGFNKMREMFSLVWDAITTEYFFYDAEKHIRPEKKELFCQIRDNILNFKLASLISLMEDLESEVNSINPEEIEMPSDKESLEMRELFTEGIEGE